MLATPFANPSPFEAALNISRGAWSAQPDSPRGSLRESESLDSLDDFPLSDRFRCWRGQSGESYVFSVYDLASCPAYREAVMIAVEVDATGRRKPLAFLDTGAFPEPVLANLTRTYANANVEFHVHLLANDIGKRRHVLSDLRGEA